MFKKPKAKALALLISLSTLGVSGVTQAAVELTGINLSAAGFGGTVIPGVHNTNYHYPEEKYFQEWSARGIKLVRFPFLWERMQNKLYAPLNQQEVQRMRQVLEYAQKYNIKMIVDIHNYNMYYGQLIGSAAVPYAAYGDFVSKFVSTFKNHSSVYAWDLMNEPHNPSTGYWFNVAQTGINAVRAQDTSRYIFIGGEAWSSAESWPTYSHNLKDLKDPANKLVYQAHIYFDPDGSGRYSNPSAANVDPQIGVKRASTFVNWLKANNKKGYIGEYGFPPGDARWGVIASNMLNYLGANCIPATYWAAGPWWGNDILAIEPINGQDRPQWSTVKKYVGKTCADFGPNNTDTSVPEPTTPPTPNNPNPPTTPTNPNNGSVSSSFNDVTGGGWLHGVSTTAAGFSIPNNSSNQSAFTVGKYANFSDGTVRRITQIYVVGQYYNVYVEGGLLNGNTVGAPKTVSVTTTSNAGNNGNSGNNGNGNSGNSGSTPSKTASYYSEYNNVSNNDWVKGVSATAAGFSIPNTVNNQQKFKVGSTVLFSNGETRKITKIFIYGNYYNVYVEGTTLNGNLIGYPNRVGIL